MCRLEKLSGRERWEQLVRHRMSAIFHNNVSILEVTAYYIAVQVKKLDIILKVSDQKTSLRCDVIQYSSMNDNNETRFLILMPVYYAWGLWCCFTALPQRRRFSFNTGRSTYKMGWGLWVLCQKIFSIKQLKLLHSGDIVPSLH